MHLLFTQGAEQVRTLRVRVLLHPVRNVDPLEQAGAGRATHLAVGRCVLCPCRVQGQRTGWSHALFHPNIELLDDPVHLVHVAHGLVGHRAKGGGHGQGAFTPTHADLAAIAAEQVQAVAHRLLAHRHRLALQPGQLEATDFGFHRLGFVRGLFPLQQTHRVTHGVRALGGGHVAGQAAGHARLRRGADVHRVDDLAHLPALGGQLGLADPGVHIEHQHRRVRGTGHHQQVGGAFHARDRWPQRQVNAASGGTEVVLAHDAHGLARFNPDPVDHQRHFGIRT